MQHTVSSAILVFKTNLETENDVESIALSLDLDIRIRKWNVDREDIDHVLRVESEDPNPQYVIQLLRAAGYRCEELLD